MSNWVAEWLKAALPKLATLTFKFTLYDFFILICQL